LKKSRNNFGYILVETLVSVTILAFGLTLVLNAFSAEINALRISKNYTHASLLLEEKFCELEKEGEIDLKKNGEDGYFTDIPDSYPDRKNFHWAVDIRGIDWLKDELGNQLLDIVAVTVTVEWPEVSGKRELSATTYMRRKIS